MLSIEIIIFLLREWERLNKNQPKNTYLYLDRGIKLSSHKHDIKKTHVGFIEFDDVNLDKLAIDTKYFGENNSQNRKLEFDFEYCLNCDLRLLNGEPVKTKDVLEQEFEGFVIKAKNGRYVASEETTMQHTDFEVLERIIKRALQFGKLKYNKK